jgi:polyhydroxybutyrate depolymerase
LIHDGQTRIFYLYIPTQLVVPDAGVPLVIALHPSGTSSAHMARITQFQALADQTGWLVVYPEGTGGYWDYGYGTDEWASVADIRDDPGFLLAMIDTIDADHQKIDRARIAAVGFSNGGRMAHRLACEMDLAAIVAVSASLGSEVVNICPPEATPSVMIWHGTADGIIPFEGKPLTMNRRVISHALSVRDSAIFWAKQAGCEGEPTIEPFYTPPASSRDVRIQRIAYTCDDKRVEAYVAENGGHDWNFTSQVNTSIEIWVFLADVMSPR